MVHQRSWLVGWAVVASGKESTPARCSQPFSLGPSPDGIENFSTYTVHIQSPARYRMTQLSFDSRLPPAGPYSLSFVDIVGKVEKKKAHELLDYVIFSEKQNIV